MTVMIAYSAQPMYFIQPNQIFRVDGVLESRTMGVSFANIASAEASCTQQAVVFYGVGLVLDALIGYRPELSRF